MNNCSSNKVFDNEILFYRSSEDEVLLLRNQLKIQKKQIELLKSGCVCHEYHSINSINLLDLPQEITNIISQYILYLRKQWIISKLNMNIINLTSHGERKIWRTQNEIYRSMTMVHRNKFIPRMIEMFGNPMDPKNKPVYKLKYKIGDYLVYPNICDIECNDNLIASLTRIMKTPDKIDTTDENIRYIFENTNMYIYKIIGITSKTYRVINYILHNYGLGTDENCKDIPLSSNLNRFDNLYGVNNNPVKRKKYFHNKVYTTSDPMNIIITNENLKYNRFNYISNNKHSTVDQCVNLINHPCITAKIKLDNI